VKHFEKPIPGLENACKTKVLQFSLFYSQVLKKLLQVKIPMKQCIKALQVATLQNKQL